MENSAYKITPELQICPVEPQNSRPTTLRVNPQKPSLKVNSPYVFLRAKPQSFFSQLLSQSGVTSGQKRDPEMLCIEVSSAEKSLLPIGNLSQLAVLARFEREGFLRRVLIASKNKTKLRREKKNSPKQECLNHTRATSQILIPVFNAGFYHEQSYISSNPSNP